MIIHDQKKLKSIIDKLKNKGQKVLMKKGVFDIIHPGHIWAIKQYKKVADVTIIAIQSDEQTRQAKGSKRPINPQDQRARVVDGIQGVDLVYLDNSVSREEYRNKLDYLRPSILAVTKEDLEHKEFYRSPYWKLKKIPNKALLNYSTTKIINKIYEQSTPKNS